VSALARPIRPLVDPSRQLRSSVDEIRAARRRAEAARFAFQGVAIGGFAAALVGGELRFADLEIGPFVAATFFLLIVGGLALIGWLRQPPLVRVTLEIDHRLGLDERVTTALELATLDRRTDNPGALSALGREQIADAVSHLAAAAAGSVYPLRVARRALALAAAGLILAALPWVAPWPVLIRTFVPPSPVELAAQAEATRLEMAARRLQSDGSTADRATRDAVAAQLLKAAAELRQAGGNTPAATRALQNAEQAMLAVSPQSAQDASQTLARIADALNADAQTQAATQALDVQDSAQAASQMAQLASNVGSMSAQQRDDLANALQLASNAARSDDSTAANQLQQAADAVRAGNPDGAQQAAQAIQQLGATSSAQRDVAQGRSELQASRENLANATQSAPANAQTGSQNSSAGQNSDQNGSAPGDTNSASAQAGSSQTGAAQNGSPGSGNQPTDGSGQPGGGAGKGTADHLGAPNDLQALAERQVTVPSNNPGDPGSVSLSNQQQVGTTGSAQVDYANVLPQYRSQALQNISGNEVPSGLKQVVKGYFDSLAPAK
jgi:hypothetical protein